MSQHHPKPQSQGKVLPVQFDIWRLKPDRFSWKHGGKTYRSTKLAEARAFANQHGFDKIKITRPQA